jgi:hypothetical protein
MGLMANRLGNTLANTLLGLERLAIVNLSILLFSLLLTNTGFSWFSMLPPDSVLAWYNMENKTCHDSGADPEEKFSGGTKLEWGPLCYKFKYL